MNSEQPPPGSFGIARRFIIAVALFSSLLTLLGTGLQLYIEYHKDLRDLQRQLQYIETSHANSLKNDLWLFNEQGLDAQMKGILSLPMIEAVQLERADGSLQKVGTPQSSHLQNHRIPLVYQHRDKAIPLGTLQLTAGSDHIVQRMQERVLLILATQFVLIFCVSTFIFILFYRLIGRHLAVMARHAATITIASLDTPLQLDRRTPADAAKDELELLVDALNTMQAQIAAYLLERRQIEDTLHEQAALLEDEIAQRQQAQEELNSINSSLEERINAAVTELRKKDELLLHQSRLLAMGDILHNIAHQWRQPLNNIAVSLQTIQYLHQRGELTEAEMGHDIASVMTILTELSGTIDDFRRFFSKDNEKREFILQELVEKAVNLTRSTLDDRGIVIDLQTEPDVRAFGYPNEYAQAVLNIVANARDVLLSRQVQQPQITIRISCEAGRSLLVIHDNGGGIDPQIMTQIFEPYFTTKAPGQGTGIGLYMAKMMIERNMGGSITARNHNGGAEFRVEL